jgi:hypothetical protein
MTKERKKRTEKTRGRNKERSLMKKFSLGSEKRVILAI